MAAVIQTMTTHFTYNAFGLRIASQLECPELSYGNGAAPDVTVRFGAVPDYLDSPNAQGAAYQVSANQFLLNVEHIARYLVCNGNEIVIDRAPEASDVDVRVFLLGSVIGALLHQRGVLPLHASAIETPQGAVAFAGPVGHGKSTLAAAFHRRGYRVLADDISAISLDQAGTPVVTPAYAQLNLWADALDKLQIEKNNLRRTRILTEKYGQPVAEGFSTQPVPLCAVYELQPTNAAQPSLEQVSGREKLLLLRNNTFRRSVLAGMNKAGWCEQIAFPVAQRIRTSRISRPHEPYLLDELANLVESDLGV